MKIIKTLATAAIAAGALFSTQSHVMAQTIGFKVGPTFSKVDFEGEDGSDQNYLKKIGGGGFVRFGMMGLSLQADVLAVTKGTTGSDSGVDASFKLDYIDVPVQARFSLGSNAMFSPYLMVGPSFGFNTGCKGEISSGGGTISGDCGDDFPVKSVDIGATGVVGFEFAAGPGNLLIEGRYTHGLSNISDDESTGKVRTRMFAAMAGYAITLK
jgi:hypothetical protein